MLLFIQPVYPSICWQVLDSFFPHLRWEKMKINFPIIGLNMVLQREFQTARKRVSNIELNTNIPTKAHKNHTDCTFGLLALFWFIIWNNFVPKIERFEVVKWKNENWKTFFPLKRSVVPTSPLFAIQPNRVKIKTCGLSS